MPENDTRLDRKGMKTVVTYVEPEMAHQIKVLAATEGITIQEFGYTALAEQLAKRLGKGAKTAQKVLAGKPG